MKNSIWILLFTLISTSLFAQKKPLNLNMHDDWKNIEDFSLSNDGQWLVYEIKPLVGDGFVVVQNMESLEADTFQRASGYKIDTENKYVAFQLAAPYDSVKAMKLRDVKEKDMPKDSLGVFVMQDDSVYIVENVKRFTLSGENASWISYTIEDYKPEQPEEDSKKKKKKKKDKKDEKKEAKAPKDKKNAIAIWNPLTGEKKVFEHAIEIAFADEADAFAVFHFLKPNWDSLQISVFNNGQTAAYFTHATEVQNAAWDNFGTQLAWLQSADTTDYKNYTLQLLADTSIQSIADSTSAFLYADFSPSKNGSVRFSKNGKQLYFGIAPVEVEDPKDTLLKDEKYAVDVWKWDDDRIQPEQLKRVKRDERKTFMVVYHTAAQKLVQLEDSVITDVHVDYKHNHTWGTSRDDSPYMVERTWTYPWRSDLYYVNTLDGRKEKITNGVLYGNSFSQTAKYATWYNTEDFNWYTVRLGSTDTINLTGSLTTNGEQFYNHEDEVPAPAYPYGIVGWTANDNQVLIQARNEIWVIDPSGKQLPKALSNGFANDNNTAIEILSFDDNAEFVNLDSTLFIKATNRTNNQTFYYLHEPNAEKLTLLYGGDFLLRSPLKAKYADQFIFRRETFQDYRNIWWLPKGKMSAELFADTKRITTTNPKKENYLWGTVEPYFWTDFNQKECKGLLFKPEDFDPSKSYPMVVYFYEKNFETQHAHRAFRPSHSTISVPFYTSNGYLVFIPDVHYSTGHPAKDAYNAIVSGAYSLAKEPWVNEHKMGIQGQSWGGYQVAALVTQTDTFAAAMAGAPVSNMTSAYGGIRWGSGLSRMFQYEQAQSRIGSTLWENPDLYIENSPVFHLPNVNTPLLIMHNDNDGAVPWYQGIEMFMGLRRLQKPTWMLVYNNEEHNLMQVPNRKDLSMRMFQFFNYYLKDEPMPQWMQDGIPALQKGKVNGYDLMDD